MMKQAKQRAIIKQSQSQREKQVKVRNPYLRLLSDDELDVLEILAKKAVKEVDPS